MTTALDRLRQALAEKPEQAFVSSVSSPFQEFAENQALARGCVKKGEGATNLLINKETSPEPLSARNSYMPPKGTDKTDKTDRALCARCGEPVTRQNGFRNWFGEPVHLCCPQPQPARNYPCCD